MTKIEFKKLVRGIGFLDKIELNWSVAKVALERGWVTPYNSDLICSRRYGKLYFVNREIFSIPKFRIYKLRDVMNSFLKSNATHLINFGEQLNY